MRRFLLLLVALSAGVAALVVHGAWRQPRPNILLVSIDSLRSDHLHSYGYARETSPTIDALARDGVRFATAISSSSWTLPAHITLLSSRPPEDQSQGSEGAHIPPDDVTLAEALKGAGYATAGFISGPFLAARQGYDQGFDVYDESAGKGGHPHRVVTSPKLVALTTQWLTRWHEARSREPFFVFLHMWDPHYDYRPPPPYDVMFDPDYTGDVTGENYTMTKKVHAGMDRRDLEHVIALYDGEVRFTDEHLGRIIDHLRDLGVLDDTIVVVTADHGEEFLEHGGTGHARTLYDEIVRIPLVMRYPRRITPGSTIAEQVRLMDVGPTILGLAGVAPPAHFGTGVTSAYREQDFSAWLTGRADGPFPDLPAFSQTALFGTIRSTRRPGAKLIVSSRPGGEQRELYDLVRDPGEHDNLAAANAIPEVAGSLAASTQEWRALWQGRGRQAAKVDLSPAHVERLRALGYVQ